MTTTPEPAEPAEAAEAAAAPKKKKRRLHLPRSKGGLLVLALLLGGFGVIVGVGATIAVHYTESAAFCGRCHTMDPQVKAYKAGVHRDVACGECHVKPGIAGFIKAKLDGIKELREYLTSSYPRPIQSPDHAKLPPVKDTCLRCHQLKEITKDGGPVRLVLRLTYSPDRANTREQVAVVLRPAGLGQQQGEASVSQIRGVHWHVQQKVTYASADPRAQKIDYVSVTEPDGTVRQYISGSKVTTSSQAASDIARLGRTDKRRVMDCLDCHNRIGHESPTVESAVDSAIAEGKISPALPYVKRDAIALLRGNYASAQDADAAVEGLRTRYQVRYRLKLTNELGARIDASINEIQRIYRRLATPGMKVTPTTYADNLGHQSSTGCFRCHDGAHYLVVKGKVTDKTIPSGCATCHTFPQLGPKVAGVLVGGEPTSHKSTLFAFNHKSLVTSTNPTRTSCGSCHVPTYCDNCHRSGAIKVRHDVMLYRHGYSARAAGVAACYYCHQRVSCEQCHKGSIPLDAKPP